MNKSNSKKNLRFILALLLSLTMVFVLVFSAACGDTESTSDSESESESESAVEETVTDKQIIANGDFEFYTTSGTSYPYSSSIKWTRSTDKGAAGVSATTSSATSGIIDVSDDAFGKLADSNKPYTVEGDETKTYYNPGTPVAADDANTEANEGGKKILMIHNKVSTDGEGTAQYFTNSETITLAPLKTAKISVWVRTDNLKSTYDGEGKEFGAYIKIINTVSTEIEPLLIKSINTESKWVNYVIYLKPSAFAVTKYKVVLGLGRGDTENKKELCEGFAFFDNVEYSIVEDYDTVTAAKEFKLYDGENKNVFEENKKSTAFVQSEKGKDYEALDYKVTYKMSFEKSEENSKKDFSDTDTGYNTDVNSKVSTEETIVIDNSKVSMTFSKGSSYTNTFNIGELKSKTYYKLSVTANVKAEGYSTNASIVLVDGDKDSESGAFTNFATDGEDVRYTLYIANKTAKAISDAKIKFSFGPTEFTNDVNSLPKGNATFSNITLLELTKAEYEAADVSNDSHAKKVSVKGALVNEPTSDDEDDEDIYSDIKEDYTFTVSGNDYSLLESLLNLNNTNADYEIRGEGTLVSSNKVKVGLVNGKFADNYGITGLKDVLDGLAEKADTTYVQPIIVNNTTATSTGLIGKTVTLSANTAYRFSVKVKAVGNAKANVYLVDTSNPKVSEFDEDDKATATYSVLRYKPAGNVLGVTIDRTISATVAANDNGDYETVTFYVVTGDEAMSLRLELYNGTRDGSAASEGYVLFDDVYTGSVSYNTFEALSRDYSPSFFNTKLSYNQNRIYSYYNGDVNDPVYDADGNREYTGTEEYIVYAEGGNVKFMRYDVVNRINSVEKTDESEEESEEESESATDTEDESAVGNLVWLQIASIIIAAALVIALVAVVLRKVFEKRTKKKAKTRSYYIGYDKNSHKVPPKRDVEAPDETDEEYHYDE